MQQVDIQHFSFGLSALNSLLRIFSAICCGFLSLIVQPSEKYCVEHDLKYVLPRKREPETVLVYGAMPDEIFKQHIYDVQFVQYDDWTSLVRKDEDN